MREDKKIKVRCNNCTNIVLSNDFCPVCNNDLSVNADYTERKKFTALKIICFVTTLPIAIIWIIFAWNNQSGLKLTYEWKWMSMEPIFEEVKYWGVFKVEQFWLSVLLHSLIVAAVVTVEIAIFFALASKQKKKYVVLPKAPIMSVKEVMRSL